ncbi:MAG: metallophosphoesterase [Deltaproteobacteria bacterium]|nr:metallophosphoesterase [Deltaproteobacteria bacterium]
MRIWGISDLHLSFSTDKPMHVFGEHWKGHDEKMAAAWDASVADDDVVLCPGDLSWAMKLPDAEKDLAWIAARKGRLKVLTRGNHDYWWSAIGKVRSALPPTLVALQNDAIDLGEVVVAGSRLWTCPGALDWDANDEKIYLREVERLRLSLVEGKAKAAGRPLLAAVHYPPFDKQQQATPYSNLLEEFGVQMVVYGHLHGRRAHRTAFEGERHGVRYHLIACDHLDFAPVLVWPLQPATQPTVAAAPASEGE